LSAANSGLGTRLPTDLELEVEEAVQAYAGRQQIEVNFDEIKELGLGHYMGRSGQGVRRWPLFLCAAQMLLKFMATGIIKVALPKLHWSWYKQENTVGQMRRRLVEYCRPRISRLLEAIPNVREIKVGANCRSRRLLSNTPAHDALSLKAVAFAVNSGLK